MPTSNRREDALIELFLSAYRENAWKGCRIDWLDRVQDGAVEALATRADNRTLAIEHTLIESFVGEREDLERFKAFLPIEDDPALRQSDRIVYINVPRGALPKGTRWEPIVTSVHRWLLANLAKLNAEDGYQYCDCPVAGPGIAVPFEIKLQITITPSAGSDRGPLIRRYGPTDVGGSVEKALTTKLPKLVKTVADVRILLLERSQWSLSEKQIWQEIQNRAAAFPLLAAITEIWFAETVFYDVPTDPRWRDYLGFNRYAGDDARLVASMEFLRGVLISKSRDGIGEVTPESRQVLGGAPCRCRKLDSRPTVPIGSARTPNAWATPQEWTALSDARACGMATGLRAFIAACDHGTWIKPTGTVGRERYAAARS